MFSSDRTAPQSLYTLPADGSTREPTRLQQTQTDIYEGVLSPEGEWLAFRQGGRGVATNIWLAPLRGEDRSPRPFIDRSTTGWALTISPDGRWLAYVSDESGRYEVYVRAFPEPGGQTSVSVNGGHSPRWAPDGSELFYRTVDGLVAASIEMETTFRVSERTVLFEDVYLSPNTAYAHYDIDPLTGHFLMLKDQSVSREIVVVLNWHEELRRQMDN